MTKTCIQAKNIRFYYPSVKALDDISFEIPRGSVTALVGPNGSGKTTLMRVICGLLEADQGTLSINNINVHDHPIQATRSLTFLADISKLYPLLSVKHMWEHGGLLHKMSKADIEARMIRLAKDLELEKHLSKKVGDLSRGLQQRAGLGFVLMHDPEIIVLDEPASGLDPMARHQLGQLIKKLYATGKTLIVSSHILSELEEYSTHMMMIEDGKILDYCDIKEATQQSQQQSCYLLDITIASDHKDKDLVKDVVNYFKASEVIAIKESRVGEVTITAKIEVPNNDNITEKSVTKMAGILKKAAQEKWPMTSIAQTKEDLQAMYQATRAKHQKNNVK